MAPVLSNEFLDIQATIERGFVLKRVRDMIRIKNIQSQEFKIVITVTLLTILTLVWKKSSAVRQKGEYQNGCYKKTKHAKSFEKGTFLTHTCTY